MNIKSNIFKLYIIAAALCLTAVVCAEYSARSKAQVDNKGLKIRNDSLHHQGDSISKSFFINHSEIK